jgi:predicted transcriptional regulator
MAVTSVRLQPEIEQGLEDIAAKLHRSKSWLINQALREYVQRQEHENARWQDTLGALDDVRQGRVVPADAVHDWLASWGSDAEPAPPTSKR